MNLLDIFPAITFKELVLVDLPAKGSNQHEIDGVAALRTFFGTNQETRGFITWIYFSKNQEPVQSEGKFTFYDARAKSAHLTGRSEWRFYYYGDFLARASVGDLLLFARTATGKYVALIFSRDSSWYTAARALLGDQNIGASFGTFTA